MKLEVGKGYIIKTGLISPRYSEIGVYEITESGKFAQIARLDRGLGISNKIMNAFSGPTLELVRVEELEVMDSTGPLEKDIEPDSTLEKFLDALGWEGGTIHQATEEVKKTREALAQVLAEKQILATRVNELNDHLALAVEGSNVEDLDKIAILSAELQKMAYYLQEWVSETRKGSWSTHLVERMVKREAEIWGVLEMVGQVSKAQESELNQCQICLCLGTDNKCVHCGHVLKPQEGV